MTALTLGLVLFLGAHSVRIVADPWRSAQIARIGEAKWKGFYTLASIAGFVLIIWGYGLARQHAIELWSPPSWTRLVAGALMLASFVLLAASYVPRNALKAKLNHPMLLGVKVWALAHVICNGTLADLLLFGGFLVWAVFGFRAARRRDRAAGTVYAAGAPAGTAIAIVVGCVLWVLFTYWAHAWLFGVPPFV